MEEGRATETAGHQTPYRVKEIAALLGVAPKTIYEEIANGALPALLIGGTYRVERLDFLEYKQHCRARAVRVAVEPEAA
jgi:excisionase family DNA binding protein